MKSSRRIIPWCVTEPTTLRILRESWRGQISTRTTSHTWSNGAQHFHRTPPVPCRTRMSRAASPSHKTEYFQSRAGHFPSTVRCTSCPSYFSSGLLSHAHQRAWLCAQRGEPRGAPRSSPLRSSYIRVGFAGCRTRTALWRLGARWYLTGCSRPSCHDQHIGSAV